MHPYVHCSIVDNSQDLETNGLSIDEWAKKLWHEAYHPECARSHLILEEIMVCICNLIFKCIKHLHVESVIKQSLSLLFPAL